MTHLNENCTEIYCYKVIYPGGAFVRVSPALNAPKTGEILEHGAVFESSKSLFLDGVNYVKLDEGRGWVFGSKGDTKVLDLIEVMRTQGNNSIVPEIESVNYSPKMHLTTSRNQSLYWREIRAKGRRCISFKDFSTLSCETVVLRPPSVPEPGPARSAWMSEHHSDLPVRRNVSLIASTTQKGAHSVANIRDLESHLWVLAHMGGSVAHIMELVVDEANLHFEKMTTSRRGELLSVALEVGAATRAHSIELAKHVDILPDDVRNFIQRWVIIKAYHTSDSTSPSSSSKSPEISSPPSSPKITSIYRSQTTPTNNKRTTSSDVLLPIPTSSLLSYWVCGDGRDPNQIMDSPRSIESSSTSSSTASSTTYSSHLSSFFGDLETYIKKLFTDPEFQFAGII